MVVTTNAIVLGAIKYGDTSLIVKCYTQKEGIKSYLLRGVLKSKKGKLKSAYFQPLTQLELVANHNRKGALNSIKEVRVIHQYETIFSDIIKQSIVLFLAEFLGNSIQEEESNPGLYQYMETALNWLDTHEDSSNFHLLFILNLTRYLGFYPDVSNQDYPYFNLLEGSFTNTPLKYDYIKSNDLIQFKKLLGITFDILPKVSFNATNRQAVLTVLIRYFKLHLNGFKEPKSLSVLKTVFS